MPDGGKLIISCCKKNELMSLIVEDTGIGIPDALKPKLFTPMMTTKAKGQGFGLAASKRIIEAMKALLHLRVKKGKEQNS